jgi:hypothetical protein
MIHQAGHRGTVIRLVESPLLQVAVIFALQSALSRWFFKFGALPLSSYFEPVLLIEAVKSTRLSLLTGFLLLVLFVERRGLAWPNLDPHGRTRWLIVGIAGIFAWVCSTYPVNLYFNQPHVLDRLAIVALWLALCRYPIAIVPFVSMVMIMVGQQQVPLPEGPWIWPDKRLPLDLLLCFMSFLLLRALLRNAVRPFILPFALLCVTGALYAHAGVNKVLLGPDPTWWLRHNDLANLFVSSYVHGRWLGGLAQETILSVAAVLHAVRLPLAAVTLLVELSGFALVFRWQLTRVLLPVFALFHLSIMASSGIFFWKWILVDGLLLWYLVMLRRDASRTADLADRARVAFFTPRLAALSLIVMLGARFYFDLVPFAWFDSKLVNRFEFYGVTESGRRYPFDARFFAPYDLLMQQSRHYALLESTVLVGTYGVTLDPVLVTALENATPDRVRRLHQQFGQRWTSPETADVYVDFIRRYVVNAQRRGGRRSVLTTLAPPFHFRTTPPGDAFDFQEPLEAVDIEFHETLYDGTAIVPVQRALIRRVWLEASSTLPTR